MKFLCDAMLGHVGKILRSAGYDTVIDEGIVSDRELVAMAVLEHRHLLTCDGQIFDIKGSAEVLIYLPDNYEDHWAYHLAKFHSVNWLYAPFTRCLICNHLLESAAVSKREHVPPSARNENLLYCHCCKKVYWEGSHVERMRRRLARFNDLGASQASTYEWLS